MLLNTHWLKFRLRVLLPPLWTVLLFISTLNKHLSNLSAFITVEHELNFESQSALTIINNKFFMLRGLLCYISISIGLNLFKVEDVLVQKWLLYVQHLSKRNIVCRSTEKSFCTKLSTYSIVSLLRPHIVLGSDLFRHCFCTGKTYS